MALPSSSPRRPGLAGLADLVVARRRTVLVLAAVLVGLAGWFGSGAVEHLSNGGYVARSADTVRADEALSSEFGVEATNLVLLVRAPGDVDSPDVAAAGRAFTDRVRASDGVGSAESYWTLGDPALRATDGRAAVVLVHLAGDEDQAQRTATTLVPRLTGSQDGLTVSATGEAEVNAELAHHSDRDLVRAELLAAPIVLLLLLLVFRTPMAALLPFAVGVIAIVLTLAVLRVLAAVTPVSVFALNLTTALGFGLAIDYSLFVLVRFREAREGGADPAAAARAAVRSAGRTVLFSALTVACCLSALLVFPLYFLRSLAYAAIPVVLLAGTAALVVLPAALVAAGRWIDGPDVTAPLRRLLRRSRRPAEPVWGRLAALVMRRPLVVAVPVVALLLLLAAPFTQARFGLTDDRVLPPGAQASTTAREIDREFDAAVLDPITVVVTGADATAVDGAAAAISLLPDVREVDAAAGRYVDGTLVAPSPAPPSAARSGEVSRIVVVPAVEPFSPEGARLVRELRELPVPATATGSAVLFVDTSDVMAGRLPAALALIGAVMTVLLFLFTGSLLLPLKAIMFNLLSLSASFGAMVFVFQDGHLRWLVGDFVVSGYLDVTVPVLMFCVAFGVSMDYEIFLLSRIREAHLETGDNTRAVVEGLGRTGSLISAAALLIGAVLVMLATSQVSLLKLLGVGLFLAVLMDALLIRGLLVPAFMALAGRANWWAPAPLRRLHARIGLHEAPSAPPHAAPAPAARPLVTT
ncbi:MMPL family transporter [Geodermatophilus sp. SYSU D00705]